MSLWLTLAVGCWGSSEAPLLGGVEGATSYVVPDLDPLDGAHEANEAIVANPAVGALLSPIKNGGPASPEGTTGTNTAAPDQGTPDPWIVYSPVSVPTDGDSTTGSFSWPFSTKGTLTKEEDVPAESELHGWKVPPSQMIDDEARSAAFVQRLEARGVNTRAIAAAAKRRAEAEKEKKEK